MNLVFYVVARALNWVASVTGFTYDEINILAYYIILPFLYVALIDRIIHKHVLKIGYVVMWIGILCLVGNFAAFADVMFKKSVDFLLLFSAVGLDYVSASVVICVLLPGAAFVVLVLFAFPTLRRGLVDGSDASTTA